MTSLCEDYGKRPVENTWKISDIESFLAILLQEINDALKISKNKDLQQHFAANLNKLNLYLNDLHKIASAEKQFKAPTLGEVAYISSDVYQFKMQQTFKAVESKIDENQAPLDVIKKIAIACSAGVDYNQEITQLLVLMDQLSHGFSASLEDLERYTKLMTEILKTLKLVQSVLVQFTDWVAVFYIHFGHVSSQILQKGLVNSIPKKEEGEGGQGKDMDDVGGENAGMGEGEGLKDVSEQIEETGQVDDLMNEDEENGTNENQEPQEKPKDSENPLEMEDDFAADLENLDNEENEKGENDDNDEPDEEPNVDWDMGDVEEPEENQLDPNLWDKPEQEDKKLDDRPEGADKQTEEIAAKENDDTVANEDNGKDDDEKDE
uniref:Uncharacterized protein n=1 Tax=Panagrolaimus superbus TaxID=310955 RepID=A0A914XYD3_9BILA